VAGPKRIKKTNEILNKLHIVKAIVNRLYTSNGTTPEVIEPMDLINAGIIGLIDAAGRYDSSKGASFSTYASFRIKGAILDELRNLDWASRSQRKKINEMENPEEMRKKKNYEMIYFYLDEYDTSPDLLMERDEIKEMIAGFIKDLPQKEQLVLKLNYFKGLKLNEISKIMNLSESRISQIRTSAILRLRAKLGGKTKSD
jgi:RNA polymerase sigma factor for flagellar operon FliA